ncbi:MAG: hypothetical protein QXW92_03690, partial [Candidatus Hadarchaeales archaeon]
GKLQPITPQECLLSALGCSVTRLRVAIYFLLGETSKHNYLFVVGEPLHAEYPSLIIFRKTSGLV